jgi:hypothetical protein
MVRRGLFITAHALARYRERVEDCPDEEIARRLSSDAIVCAVRFGAHQIRLGTGQLVVIEDASIVTILPAAAKKPRHRTPPSKLRGRRPDATLAVELAP